MRRRPLNLSAGFEPGVESPIEHRTAAMPNCVEKPDSSRRQRAAEIFDEDDGFPTVQPNAPSRFSSGVGKRRDRFGRRKGQPNLVDINMRRARNTSGLVVIEGARVYNDNLWLTEIGAEPGDINNGTRI